MLPKAQKTGNFTLLPNRLARELRVDDEGRVRFHYTLVAVRGRWRSGEAPAARGILFVLRPLG
jgi:hypothetical protein